MNYLRMIRACVALMTACYEFADNVELDKQTILKGIEECLKEMFKIYQDMRTD